ncbi:Sec-independent protein translocase protein TatA [bacterium HR17]|uniref:Sec-independent protein translocase protein TatA n=1 Tax=Candidatus Fervidibacter japonicus TaxID=2035412 RepID=A0A2H5XEE1_9BACT|nr:Sec-independent protein translocase protein TatA [bacterium HR17]
MLGPTELLIIGGVVVLLFGAKKVPELLGSLGQGIKEFKKAMREEEDAPKSTEAEGSSTPRSTQAK